MKLWLLKPKEGLPKDEKLNPWEPWYDCMFSIVVREESEAFARQLVASKGACEIGNIKGLNPWLDVNFSTCNELSLDGPSGVIITDVAEA